MRRLGKSLTDSPLVLRGSGDVWVGASARIERRKRILMALAGAALLGVAVCVHLLLRPHAVVDHTGKSPVYVKCVAPGCGFAGIVYLAVGEAERPVKCPKCGELSCRKVWECQDCHYQFLPIGAPTEWRCERCGSQRVGTAEEPPPSDGE